jgi:DNA repair exonuclease SbcCD ATPase subunit
MAKQTCKEASRTDFTISGETPTMSNITLGVQQRLADAAEKTAEAYTKLLSERDMYRHFYSEATDSLASATRQLTATKGHLTRMKKKLAQAETMEAAAFKKTAQTIMAALRETGAI